jgi:NhaP-type Na+/H+ or K+/H+ antiporter
VVRFRWAHLRPYSKPNFLSSLAVAACLTPTDPILAAAVVGGKYAEKHVPAHIRHLLAAECGCNDGAAFPFLFIALYLTTNETVGDAIAQWFLDLWLCKSLLLHNTMCPSIHSPFLPHSPDQILLSIVYGSILGFGFRHLMKFCEKKG